MPALFSGTDSGLCFAVTCLLLAAAWSFCFSFAEWCRDRGVWSGLTGGVVGWDKFCVTVCGRLGLYALHQVGADSFECL